MVQACSRLMRIQTFKTRLCRGSQSLGTRRKLRVHSMNMYLSAYFEHLFLIKGK